MGVIRTSNPQSVDFQKTSDAIEIRINVARQFEHELHQIDFAATGQQFGELGTGFELTQENGRWFGVLARCIRRRWGAVLH